MTPVDPQALQLAEADYRDAQARVETLRQVRNDVVCDAIQQGWTHAQISQATGLTRGRIGQIAQRIAIATTQKGS
jgi:hypothetical protein